VQIVFPVDVFRVDVFQRSFLKSFETKVITSHGRYKRI